jgi:hypothetical protein
MVGSTAHRREPRPVPSADRSWRRNGPWLGHTPFRGQLCERCQGRNFAGGEEANVREVGGRSDLRACIESLVNGKLHVGLAAAEPDVAVQNVLERDRDRARRGGNSNRGIGRLDRGQGHLPRAVRSDSGFDWSGGASSGGDHGDRLADRAEPPNLSLGGRLLQDHMVAVGIGEAKCCRRHHRGGDEAMQREHHGEQRTHIRQDTPPDGIPTVKVRINVDRSRRARARQ